MLIQLGHNHVTGKKNNNLIQSLMLLMLLFQSLHWNRIISHKSTVSWKQFAISYRLTHWSSIPIRPSATTSSQCVRCKSLCGTCKATNSCLYCSTEWHSDLPQNKMFTNNMFDCWVAPHVTVQHLTWELLHVLNIDYQPLVGCPTSITCLHSTRHEKLNFS